MPVGIFEVKTATAATFVDLAVGVAEGPTAIGNPFRLNPIENLIELGLADMKRIVVTVACRFVSESECQALIDLHFGEMTVIRDGQSENLGEKIRCNSLVFRRHNGVV